MAKRVGLGSISVVKPNNKGTSIGRKNIKMSSMNKNKKRTYKKYRGQG
jgi:hypothetical protein